MKKYLFLLFLFILYLMLISKPKTITTFKNNNKVYSVDEFYICFKNGFNSKKMGLLLKLYSDEYLIKEIFIKNDKIDVLCSNFKECESNVYDTLDNEFELTTIASGFKIDRILIIANEEKIEEFLTLHNINYWIVNYKKNSSL